MDGARCFTDFLHERGLSQVVELITREHVEMFLERQLAAHKTVDRRHEVPVAAAVLALVR